MEAKNPAQFWKVVKDLQRDWDDYYNKLYDLQTSLTHSMKGNEFLKAYKELCEFLNKEVTNTEIPECIKLLHVKNGNSVSEDMIFNEPLKAGSKILLIQLEKLF